MKKALAICLLIALLLMPTGASAAPPDFDVPSGHFFTQAGSGDGNLGFTVVDDGQARFWSEFKRLGGVAGVGYPISHRFTWNGFVVQAMQKGVMQWRPEVGRAYFVNVFDEMSTAGKDDWLLAVRSTPRPLGAEFDAGKNWNEIVSSRLALLNANSAIKARYHAVADPMNLYGLPTSPVVDNGNHYAIRLQRALIQQWKVAVPWATAGQVTLANGGDVGKEAGLFPATALAPLPANQSPPPTGSGSTPASHDSSTPSSRGDPRPASAQQAALDIANRYRTMAGAPPLTSSDALQRAASAHASYYVQNYGDRSLVGMGLHYETAGKPGFTGANWTDRARAAGYNNWAVDENIGLVGDPQKMIDWCVGTINHRLNLLHPSAVHLGYGISSRPAVDVLDLGLSGTRPTVALPTTYPGDGQQGVPTSSNIWETPDPAPGVPRPLGFPITISFHLTDSVTFAEFSLVDSLGQPVQLYTSQKSWLRSLALIPSRPLRPGEKYTVRVAGTINGKPFEKTWSFTTQ